MDWKGFERDAEAELIALGTSEEEARVLAARKREQTRLRIEWADQRLRDFFEMQEKAGEGYMRQIEEHPEVEDWDSPDAPQLPEPPEEAVAQAIYQEVMDAIERDRWPRHLHFPCV
jgi:hypothetical protein